PGKFRTAVVMERGCDLLTDTALTVREIADALGYCDEYHFSKQFSKTIGWSPSEYRARAPKRS
ncbi:MAG: AraC family transcriptional regulator, partial [Pseudomonadota bacterium]